MINALSWFLGWMLFFILLGFLAKTEWGAKIVYYIVWLMVVFLIVANYRQITDILKPVTNPQNA